MGTDALIGVSQATVDDLVHLGVADAGRFRVVPLGLDLDRFAAIDGSARQWARRQLGVRHGEVVCTFVGRIAPIKRVDLLIEAFAAARAVNPQLRLFLVGDGEQRSDLEQRAAALALGDFARFFGYRGDLELIWAASDIAVLTSRNEGTPVSLIEAAAAGLPAVAMEVGGVREALWSGAAVILSADDQAQVTAGLVELAADPSKRRKMGSAAREFALDSFNFERLAADIDAIYGELLDLRQG